MCEEPWICLTVMFSPSIILKGKQNDCVNVEKYLFELEACSVHSDCDVRQDNVCRNSISPPPPPKKTIRAGDLPKSQISQIAYNDIKWEESKAFWSKKSNAY